MNSSDSVGIPILLLVAYQLWGTGLYEAREQDKLQAQFAKELAREKAAARKGGHRDDDHDGPPGPARRSATPSASSGSRRSGSNAP